MIRFSWMLRLLALVGLLPFVALPTRSQALTEVRVVLDHDAVRPGDSLTAGVELKMPPGWHT